MAMFATPSCTRQVTNELRSSRRMVWGEERERRLTTLYQQGCPRRVIEASIMSSATRKYACSWRRHELEKREWREVEPDQFDAPAERSGSLVVLLAQRLPLQDLSGVHDRNPSVQLASGRVVVQILRPASVSAVWRPKQSNLGEGARWTYAFEPSPRFSRHFLLVHVREQLVSQRRPHREETFTRSGSRHDANKVVAGDKAPNHSS